MHSGMSPMGRCPDWPGRSACMLGLTGLPLTGLDWLARCARLPQLDGSNRSSTLMAAWWFSAIS